MNHACALPCPHVSIWRSPGGSIAIISQHTYMGRLVHVTAGDAGTFESYRNARMTLEFIEDLGFRELKP